MGMLGAAPSNEIGEFKRRSVRHWRGKRCAEEFPFFARLQAFSSFKRQDWGSLQSHTGVIWQASIPLALLSAHWPAMQLVWHRIAAVSWWRSFQSLNFPLLSWQQLLSRACWNPFSHSVNAMHRKVGCSHQSPSLSEICLIENKEGCCTTVDLAYFPRTWHTLILQQRFEELWLGNIFLIAE